MGISGVGGAPNFGPGPEVRIPRLELILKELQNIWSTYQDFNQEGVFGGELGQDALNKVVAEMKDLKKKVDEFVGTLPAGQEKNILDTVSSDLGGALSRIPGTPVDEVPEFLGKDLENALNALEPLFRR